MKIESADEQKSRGSMWKALTKAVGLSPTKQAVRHAEVETLSDDNIDEEIQEIKEIEDTNDITEEVMLRVDDQQAASEEIAQNDENPEVSPVADMYRRAREILHHPNCDPRKPDLFAGITLSELTTDEMTALRNLFCSCLSTVDRRIWSSSGFNILSNGSRNYFGRCSRNGAPKQPAERKNSRVSSKCGCLACFTIAPDGKVSFRGEHNDNCLPMTTHDLKSNAYISRGYECPNKEEFAEKVINNEKRFLKKRRIRKLVEEQIRETCHPDSPDHVVSRYFVNAIIRTAKKRSREQRELRGDVEEAQDIEQGQALTAAITSVTASHTI